MKKRMMTLLSALLLVCSPAAQATAQDLSLYEDICTEVGEEYGICPEVLEALIFYESAGDPDAESSCGAIGVAQIRPSMHSERMEKLGITDLHDPEQNIRCSADYLMELSKKYDIYEALVAYNCGEHSEEMSEVLEGGSNVYADKILTMSAELEKEHFK